MVSTILKWTLYYLDGYLDGLSSPCNPVTVSILMMYSDHLL